ncbi:MAG TPA: PP2C family serine/threonine-protein phosphatase [Burkholderiales bacterium]|nr:PP2C family serine/threonine-protein phosphatase [Burkholderiales bacterium]
MAIPVLIDRGRVRRAPAVSPDGAAVVSIGGVSRGSADGGVVPDKPVLQLRFGHATASVPGKGNEDFHGIVSPLEQDDVRARGIAVAIADGVSGNGGGRLASEIAVKSLLRDFYAAPAQWHITYTLDRLLRSVNDWLAAENARHLEYQGMVAALSMMVFRDNHYHMAHVGDTRVYRRRGDVLRQLTTDHTWGRGDMRHVLKRAVGLDTHLVADYTGGEILAGDVFLLASDGVWEVLGERLVREIMHSGAGAQEIADRLVERSMANQVQYMGRNDATPVVVAVETPAGAR